MPELPEVETTVNDLKKFVIGLKIVDFWTDTPKRVSFFRESGKNKNFLDLVGQKKIEKIERVGKNIVIHFSGKRSVLIHQKIAGHILFGKWSLSENKWTSRDIFLSERINSFIRFVFVFNNKKMMVISDPRKFAKVEVWDTEQLEKKLEKEIGPDPTKINFEEFNKLISARKGIIKRVLMDQSILSGIGNIYSDEALWKSKINPYRPANEITEKEMKKLFKAIKDILNKAIKLKGDSMSDYRLIDGTKGKYQNEHKVYQKEGEKCYRKDGGTIERKKINNRSLRFCPVCQK